MTEAKTEQEKFQEQVEKAAPLREYARHVAEALGLPDHVIAAFDPPDSRPREPWDRAVLPFGLDTRVLDDPPEKQRRIIVALLLHKQFGEAFKAVGSLEDVLGDYWKSAEAHFRLAMRTAFDRLAPALEEALPLPGEAFSASCGGLHGACISDGSTLEAHYAGLAYAFHAYKHDPESSVSFIDGEHPISVLVCPGGLHGIAMTRDDARALGAELLDVADKEPPTAS